MVLTSKSEPRRLLAKLRSKECSSESSNRPTAEWRRSTHSCSSKGRRERSSSCSSSPVMLSDWSSRQRRDDDLFAKRTLERRHACRLLWWRRLPRSRSLDAGGSGYLLPRQTECDVWEQATAPFPSFCLFARGRFPFAVVELSNRIHRSDDCSQWDVRVRRDRCARLIRKIRICALSR